MAVNAHTNLILLMDLLCHNSLFYYLFSKNELYNYIFVQFGQHESAWIVERMFLLSGRWRSESCSRSATWQLRDALCLTLFPCCTTVAAATSSAIMKGHRSAGPSPFTATFTWACPASEQGKHIQMAALAFRHYIHLVIRTITSIKVTSSQNVGVCVSFQALLH